MKVSDEALFELEQSIAAAGPWLIWLELLEEIRALHEVAKAAKSLSDSLSNHRGGRWEVLRKALNEVGS